MEWKSLPDLIVREAPADCWTPGNCLPDVGNAEVHLPLLVVELGIGVELVDLRAFYEARVECWVAGVDLVSVTIYEVIPTCFFGSLGLGGVEGEGGAGGEVEEPVVAQAVTAPQRDFVLWLHVESKRNMIGRESVVGVLDTSPDGPLVTEIVFGTHGYGSYGVEVCIHGEVELAATLHAQEPVEEWTTTTPEVDSEVVPHHVVHVDLTVLQREEKPLDRPIFKP